VPLAEITSIRVPGLGREHVLRSWGVGVPALEVGAPTRLLRCCFGVRPSEADSVAQRLRTARERATHVPGTGDRARGAG
jgi:hypothetical protein